MERALLVDRFGYKIQCFTPSSGVTPYVVRTRVKRTHEKILMHEIGV
jgi:hypothetical protein